MLLVTAACSPTFNWRVIPNTDIGYQATFPDKPVTATREIALAGHTVPLTLQAAVVNDIYFAVGTVPLTNEWADKAQDLQLALAEALSRNVNVTFERPKSLVWQGKPALESDVIGKIPDGKKIRAVGRFLQYNGHVIEVLVMGPEGEVTELELTQFIGGFSLLGQ